MNLNGIKITWLGHSTFLVDTPGGKKVILDPWVTGNPATPANKKSIDKIDYMLCSHGHSDHFADAVDLAKAHNPRVVGMYEPCGFVIEFENGVKLYHAGDTNVFGDMALIRELYAPDICMLPIGDLFTMG